jgi:hypothetical protein
MWMVVKVQDIENLRGVLDRLNAEIVRESLQRKGMRPDKCDVSGHR